MIKKKLLTNVIAPIAIFSMGLPNAYANENLQTDPLCMRTATDLQTVVNWVDKVGKTKEGEDFKGVFWMEDSINGKYHSFTLNNENITYSGTLNDNQVYIFSRYFKSCNKNDVYSDKETNQIGDMLTARHSYY